MASFPPWAAHCWTSVTQPFPRCQVRPFPPLAQAQEPPVTFPSGKEQTVPASRGCRGSWPDSQASSSRCSASAGRASGKRGLIGDEEAPAPVLPHSQLIEVPTYEQDAPGSRQATQRRSRSATSADKRRCQNLQLPHRATIDGCAASWLSRCGLQPPKLVIVVIGAPEQSPPGSAMGAQGAPAPLHCHTPEPGRHTHGRGASPDAIQTSPFG